MLRFHPVLSLALVVAVLVPAAATGQVEGSLSQTLIGGGLGVYSGSTLGLIGGMLPCNRTDDGRRCVVSSAGTGAALGLAAGGFIGSQSVDALNTRLEGAILGSGAGAVLGVALVGLVDQYGWRDAAAMTLVGGAVGGAPYGAALGAGVGVVTGSLVWLVSPDGGVQDLVLFTLAGVALGGMLDWADGAANRDRTGYRLSFAIGT